MPAHADMGDLSVYTLRAVRRLSLTAASTSITKSSQNVYFNASCNWRMGIPKAKPLMTPKP